MFCTKCGTEVQQTALFCPSCGAPQQAPAEVVQQTSVQLSPPSVQQPSFQANQNAAATQSPVQGFYADAHAQNSVRYGGFWIRVVASLIDTLIVTFVSWLIAFGVGLSLGLLMGIAGASEDTVVVMSTLVGYVASLLVNWYYFTYMESSARQATFGKLALGLAVTDMNGNRISFGRANARYFAKFLSALIFMIGFLMVAFTQKKQGLHDLIASTLVVKK